MKEEGFATAVQPDIQETSAPVVPKEYRLYFGLLVTCFALWGLLNNMTDNLVPSFAKIFGSSGIPVGKKCRFPL